MTYNVDKIPPQWARDEASRRTNGGKARTNMTETEWKISASAIQLGYRHLAWMIATHEKEPTNPQVILARRLYKAAMGWSIAAPAEVENDDAWTNGAHVSGVNNILEILNETR